MDETRLVRLKRRVALSFPVECRVDDGLNSSAVFSRGGIVHPRGVIVHKGDGASVPCNFALYKFCVEEEEQDLLHSP